MPVLRPLLPHPPHLRRRRLEVAEVLLADPRLLVHLYRVPREGRRLRVVGRERLQDPFGRLARAPVRRRVEVERVIGAEEGAELAPGFEGPEGMVSNLSRFSRHMEIQLTCF